jgi:hypothetical protein
VPTHRLTGNDLEELLARVPAEHGPDAVIVEANKLRTGGLGGFFAKESFEVMVEAPEGAAVPATGRPTAAAQPDRPRRGTSIDDLIAAASDGDGFEAGSAPATTAAEAPLRAPQRPLRAEPIPTPEAAPVTAQPSPGASAPTLSTDGAPFADVLGRLVRDLTAEDAPSAPDAPFEPFPAVRVVGPRMPAAPAESPTALAAQEPQAAVVPSPEAPAHPQVAPAIPRPALEPAWLAQLGVPEEVAANLLPIGDPAIELLRMLERIPRPEALPTAPGCVIAVVGRREEAQEIAEAIAGSLRLDPDGIVVASPRFGRSPLPQERRITCAEHADDRRRAWRRRRTPTIVAVDAPVSLDPGGTSWALHLVDALEPSQVWGVVDATRKTEDVAAWNELVGGIDALAVTHLHATSSPAAILGAGIPVGLIDGHDATPARWAAVLTERIAA